MTKHEQWGTPITPEFVSTKTWEVSGIHWDKKKEGWIGIASYTLVVLGGAWLSSILFFTSLRNFAHLLGLIAWLVGLILSIIGVIKGKRGLTLVAMIISIAIFVLWVIMVLSLDALLQDNYW